MSGCASQAKNATDAAPAAPPLSESDQWKTWEYPNNVGRSVTDSASGDFVLYQASTRDSYRQVVEHYESVSGIKGMAASHSAGAWVANHVEGRERVHASQTVADFGQFPADRAPDVCTFVLRMPDYVLTAFIRQEPAGSSTHITLVYEKTGK